MLGSFGCVFTKEKGQERRLGSIPMEGSPDEVAMLCDGKPNVGRAVVTIPLCQSFQVVCGGMS